MTVKQLKNFFAALEDHQTISEEHQKQINTKLDQIIVAVESLTTKFDNLTQDFVQ